MKIIAPLLLMSLTLLAFAGCIASDDAAAPSEEGIEPTTAPAIRSETGVVLVSLATPLVSFNYGEGYSFPITPRETTTGYIIEVHWDAVSPASENLDLWVRDAAAGAVPPATPEDALPVDPIATVTGPSPLRLELGIDRFPDLREHSILVRAAGPAGAAYEQPFELRLATFDDLEFDAGFAFDADDAADAA